MRLFKASPACIILDFMMYGKNGFQLLVEMQREHAKLPPSSSVTSMHSGRGGERRRNTGCAYLSQQPKPYQRAADAKQSQKAIA